jgi:hypothetical protein
VNDANVCGCGDANGCVVFTILEEKKYIKVESNNQEALSRVL